MKYTVTVRPARKKKLHHIAAETAVRRHKAVMEGIQHRDEKLMALTANMLHSDLERLQGTMAQVPQAAVPAVQAAVTQLQRDLKEISQAAHRQRL